ncbi:MAG TPA: ABC transporter permease [Candidatus Limnocylindria bacterium]|nr:ABC transporter permease [Candidatus Limnocylindria bacterium]
MSLRRTLAITGRLLRQFRHDHRTLGILFVTPLLVLALFAVLFRTDAPAPDVAVVVTGESPFGSAVADALTEADDLTATRLDSTDQADARLRDGSLDAYIVLPDPDADGVLRPELVITGEDRSVAARVPAALQRSVMAAVAGAAPPGALPRLEPEIRALYGGDEELDSLDLLGGPFIGLLVFFLVYVVTSVSFLRERSLGTLERLMASPLRRLEIVVGYMLGFTVVALIQAAEVLGFGLIVLDLYNAGPVWLIFGIEVLLALGAVNLGIFLSTFARNEFQAVQFIPLVVVPQVLLSGLLVPVSSEPEWLQWISNALPLTYAVDGLREVMLRGADLASQRVQLDVAVLAAFCVVAIIAAAATLRREVA